MKRELFKQEALKWIPLFAVLLMLACYSLFQLSKDMSMLTGTERDKWSEDYERITVLTAETYLETTVHNGYSGSYGAEQIYGALFMKFMTKRAGDAAQMFAVLAFLAGALSFFGEKLPHGADFLYSLPVTKKSLFALKMKCAAAAIIIPWLVYSAGTLIQQAGYRTWLQRNAAVSSYYDVIMRNETVLHAAAFLGLMLLVVLAVYMLSALMQVLCENAAFGAVAGALWLFAPFYVSAMLNHYLLLYMGKELTGYMSVQAIFRPANLFREETIILWDPSAEGIVLLQGIGLPVAKYAVYALLLAVCGFTARKIYARCGVYGYRGTRRFERAAILLAGLYVGLAAVRINPAAGMNAPTMIAAVAVTGAVTVLILNRLFRIPFVGGRKRAGREAEK